jgi:mono/diheme cytochrome c family protein
LFARWKALVSIWVQNRKWPLAIGLFTISLAISGCERQAPEAPAGLLTSREAQWDGAAIFAAHCSICHGVNGDGRGLQREGMDPLPANLTLPPWSDAPNAGQTFLAIRNGVPRTAMPSWPTLSDRQIWDLVAYITARKNS